MEKKSYFAMRRDQKMASGLLTSDFHDFTDAAMKLANHAIKLGGLGFGTTFLEWIASFAAMGEIGNWIAFVAVILRLFFPKHFPDWLELPCALILLISSLHVICSKNTSGHLAGLKNLSQKQMAYPILSA
ncbi:hypothetical protein SADUNF_Sadunf04G0105400 [Salix dunnii]|uniref:Uncharacterized protein n=1 Tax=Salix dunnii TaxID=1413687 RepID=A0A835KE84_9ROSI|nr:hypothetical protein SADUNF_Sadunf04G0105400 [Salix dunnii]